MKTAAILAALSPEVCALLQSSYGKPVEDVVSRVVVRNAPAEPKAPKASKLRAVKAERAEAPRVQRQGVEVPATFLGYRDTHNEIMPRPGTYNATTFLVAMRRAATRDDQIRAIAGYVGYDIHGDFGSQCLAARLKAQRTLRPVEVGSAPEVHTVRPTLAGYVSGVCDEQAKRRADVEARIRLSDESIVKLDAIIDGSATPEQRAEVLASYECPEALVEKMGGWQMWATVLRTTEQKTGAALREQLKSL